ncbi:glycosyltransferase [Pseudoduganella sp. RAF53_2]|uniref:glycosyltransferase n=1 Tax=unclassified Pseudoduganella TaxID=2637179 RepID=UPI003F987762
MMRRVLASILNWNSAEATLECVDSLLRQRLPGGVELEIWVIDNGSADEDGRLLEQGLATRPVHLRREARNHGFAGGHNIALQAALAAGAEFAWLVNSDAKVPQDDVLALLLAEMDADPTVGAAAPLLADLNNPDKIYYCGAFHDWGARQSKRPANVEQARQWAERMPMQQWVPGTAILLRAKALQATGLLDERMFAYYEDDEMGARLSRAGWRSAVAYGARVQHAMPKRETDRPPYYFYLMARNYLLFWHGATPQPWRRLLWLKLLDYALYHVYSLRAGGHAERAEAALLGVQDFLAGRTGRPQLERRAGLALRLAGWMLRPQHRRAWRRASSV